MSKTLLCHMIGELGHELMSWNSYIRALSERYDKTIVITRPLNGALYVDFADEIHSYTPSTNKANHSTCVDEMPEGYYDQFDYDDIIPANTTIAKWLPGKGVWINRNIFPKGMTPEWRKFGNIGAAEKYDIILHCRSTTKMNSGRRNWGLDNWMELVQNLQEFNIACIGTANDSLWIPGTYDFRGVGMQRVMDLMANAKLVVGSSSGPMHLSALTLTPSLVISDKINRRRYMEDWNFFRTPCIFYSEGGWKPNPQEVEKLIKEYFNK